MFLNFVTFFQKLMHITCLKEVYKKNIEMATKGALKITQIFKDFIQMK